MRRFVREETKLLLSLMIEFLATFRRIQQLRIVYCSLQALIRQLTRPTRQMHLAI